MPKLESTLLARQCNDVLELDEVWSFWGDKRSGQLWLWVALCRRTRQVVGFSLGDRSDQTCRQLYHNIAQPYRNCATVSDFWESSDKIFPHNSASGNDVTAKNTTIASESLSGEITGKTYETKKIHT